MLQMILLRIIFYFLRVFKFVQDTTVRKGIAGGCLGTEQVAGVRVGQL